MDKVSFERAREDAMEFIIVEAAEMAGVFEALREPGNPEEIAYRLGLDPRATKIVLLALASLGLSVEEQGKFKASESAEKLFLRKDDPDFVGSGYRHSLNILRSWVQLPQVMKTGEPARRDPSGPSDEGTKAFMQAMDGRLGEDVPWTVQACERKAGVLRTVLDIGGGPGRFAKAFASRADRVVLLDLPQVIDVVGEAFGLSKIPNIELLPGDMSQPLPPGPFDVAFLGDICHMWSPDQNRGLFRRIAEVLRQGGVLALVDFVRGSSTWAPIFAVNMLVNTEGGNTYTLEEFTEWLTAAGFGEVEIHNTPCRECQLVLAKKI